MKMIQLMLCLIVLMSVSAAGCASIPPDVDVPDERFADEPIEEVTAQKPSEDVELPDTVPIDGEDGQRYLGFSSENAPQFEDWVSQSDTWYTIADDNADIILDLKTEKNSLVVAGRSTEQSLLATTEELNGTRQAWREQQNTMMLLFGAVLFVSLGGLQ